MAPVGRAHGGTQDLNWLPGKIYELSGDGDKVNGRTLELENGTTAFSTVGLSSGVTASGIIVKFAVNPTTPTLLLIKDHADFLKDSHVYGLLNQLPKIKWVATSLKDVQTYLEYFLPDLKDDVEAQGDTTQTDSAYDADVKVTANAVRLIGRPYRATVEDSGTTEVQLQDFQRVFPAQKESGIQLQKDGKIISFTEEASGSSSVVTPVSLESNTVQRFILGYTSSLTEATKNALANTGQISPQAGDVTNPKKAEIKDMKKGTYVLMHNLGRDPGSGMGSRGAFQLSSLTYTVGTVTGGLATRGQTFTVLEDGAVVQFQVTEDLPSDRTLEQELTQFTDDPQGDLGTGMGGRNTGIMAGLHKLEDVVAEKGTDHGEVIVQKEEPHSAGMRTFFVESTPKKTDDTGFTTTTYQIDISQLNENEDITVEVFEPQGTRTATLSMATRGEVTISINGAAPKNRTVTNNRVTIVEDVAPLTFIKVEGPDTSIKRDTIIEVLVPEGAPVPIPIPGSDFINPIVVQALHAASDRNGWFFYRADDTAEYTPLKYADMTLPTEADAPILYFAVEGSTSVYVFKTDINHIQEIQSGQASFAGWDTNQVGTFLKRIHDISLEESPILPGNTLDPSPSPIADTDALFTGQNDLALMALQQKNNLSEVGWKVVWDHLHDKAKAAGVGDSGRTEYKMLEMRYWPLPKGIQEVTISDPWNHGAKEKLILPAALVNGLSNKSFIAADGKKYKITKRGTLLDLYNVIRKPYDTYFKQDSFINSKANLGLEEV